MTTVRIRNEPWEIDYVRSMLSGLRNSNFTRTTWAPRDALVSKDRSRATPFTGQDFDPQEYTLEKRYWDHDHCEVCNWKLIDTLGDDHRIGYFNGYNWLCEECFKAFIVDGKADDSE